MKYGFTDQAEGQYQAECLGMTAESPDTLAYVVAFRYPDNASAEAAEGLLSVKLDELQAENEEIDFSLSQKTQGEEVILIAYCVGKDNLEGLDWGDGEPYVPTDPMITEALALRAKYGLMEAVAQQLAARVASGDFSTDDLPPELFPNTISMMKTIESAVKRREDGEPEGAKIVQSSTFSMRI